jgi:hypothetical protein
MADISIPWKKITRGLPRGKKYADVDRKNQIQQVEENREDEENAKATPASFPRLYCL